MTLPSDAPVTNTLFQYSGSKTSTPRLLSRDPECQAMSAVLQFSGVCYRRESCDNPSMSPSGSLPFLRLQTGQLISSVDDIVTYCRSKVDLRTPLNATAAADVAAYTDLIRLKLGDAFLFWSWCNEENYKGVTEGVYGATLSWPLRPIVVARTRSAIKALLASRNTACDADSFHELARVTLNALATKLGRNTFLMGEQKTTADAFLFGYLSVIAGSSLPVDVLRELLLQHSNLCAYTERISQLIK